MVTVMPNISMIGNLNSSYTIGWCGCLVTRCMVDIRVDGLSGVRHLSDIALSVVSMVVDSLDPGVGESHRVGALDTAGTVAGL